MSERLFTRRTVLGLAVAAGLGYVVNENVTHKDEGFRPLDGKPREEGTYRVLIAGYEDKENGQYYTPVFRDGPSIEAREWTDEDLKAHGYTQRDGQFTGKLVFGDSGNEDEPVKVVRSTMDTRDVYHAWIKLENGGYISENFVRMRQKIEYKQPLR